MRRMRLAVLGLVLAASLACGPELAPEPPASADPPRFQPVLTLVRSEIDEGQLQVREERMENAILAVRRKLLAPVMPRLYFIEWTGIAPQPDSVRLRVIGREPVILRRVEIKDDLLSPFGEGAAQFFRFRVLPETDVIDVDHPVDIEVEYVGKTSTMQNAILEIRSDAANLPLIRVGLTGKLSPF
jgi:hypothetical protein